MTESALARPFFRPSSQGGGLGEGTQGAGGMTESALARPFLIPSSQGGVQGGNTGGRRMTGSALARYELRGTFHVGVLAALRPPRGRCRRERGSGASLRGAIGG